MKKKLFSRLKTDMQKEGWNPRHVTAIVVFGAIVIVFVFMGTTGHQVGTGAAAQVGSTLISAAELGQETDRLEKMYAPMFGGQLTGDAQRQFLRTQAMENLISQELMAQGAKRIGIKVADAEVRDVITRDIPAFQDKGRFQHERYLAILDANRWTAGEFENRIRKERGTQRWQRALEQAATPLQIELNKMQALRGTKREVLFAKFSRESFLEKMPISDADMKNALANADLQKKVEADFEANKGSYGVAEKVRAAHILVKTTPGDTDSEKKALEKITAIQKRAEKEDFGKLAAEVSEDAGSKTNKGDLGTFERGRMVPEFENAAFSQKPGTVSAPVKSQFGYHLIKVLDHMPAVEAKLDANRAKITRKVLAADKYDALAKSLEDAVAKGDVAETDKIVKQMGLTWEDSGFFDLLTPSAPKIGSAEATALALGVSQQAPLAKKLARENGMMYVVKWKADKKEPATAEELKADSMMARERSYDLITGWLEAEKKTASIDRNPQILNGR